MKPSDFNILPTSSIYWKFDDEVVARNIMAILARTGNEWRTLSFDEYKQERLKDSNWYDIEEYHFKRVNDYCRTEKAERLFSPTWKDI